MKIKLLLIVICSFSPLLLLGLFIYGNAYYNDYHLKSSETTVKDFIEEFIDSSIQIMHFERIEETNMWLVQLKINDSKYGHARFNKGWNGKLKFIYLATDPTVTYREHKTNKGNYGTLYVHELDSNVAKIKLTPNWKNFEKEIEVDTVAPFMKTFKLPENVEDTFPAMFTFYDKTGEVIYDYSKHG
ncbi:hypothetical protein [Lysinibacillus sp. JNUCC-52]|uniref:hypothetical protein n=1 Tax=Lysinibacillus sp. JNUCC-52 TaxID=2792480 RepID=UPI001935EC8E|nr:hypothetical protein JNUCC52_01375 [Lysinibacillus sp. JNUCC-52]